MSTKSIEIKKNPTPTPSQPAVFSPSAVVANAGDNLTWQNADDQAHWPAPSASDATGWLQFQIPAGGSSRGDVALSRYLTAVTAATNAKPVVLTLSGTAPATGAQVTVTFAAASKTAPPTPWKNATGTYVATNLGPNSCSIPLDTSAFGAWSSSLGTLTVGLPYTLNYLCALHPAETGTITVNPQP